MYDEVGPQFAYKLVQEGYTYVDGEGKNNSTSFRAWRLPTWGWGRLCRLASSIQASVPKRAPIGAHRFARSDFARIAFRYSER